MEEHEKLEMEDLKNKLEAILKVQKEENDATFHTNSNTASRFICPLNFIVYVPDPTPKLKVLAVVCGATTLRSSCPVLVQP